MQNDFLFVFIYSCQYEKKKGEINTYYLKVNDDMLHILLNHIQFC